MHHSDSFVILIFVVKDRQHHKDACRNACTYLFNGGSNFGPYKVHSPLDMKILQKMKKMNKETPDGGNLVK